MLKISRKVEYALISVKHMLKAGEERLVSAREISTSHKLPRELVSKVLQTLTHGGILESEQGKHGGYRMRVPLKKVTVLDLHELLEGPFVYASCTGGEGHSCLLEKTCTVSRPVKYLEKKIRDLFARTTLYDLLEEADETASPGDKKSYISSN